jgi:hypothetical protein
VKETYEQFAEVFTCLDARDFVEVIGCKLECLFRYPYRVVARVLENMNEFVIQLESRRLLSCRT